MGKRYNIRDSQPQHRDGTQRFSTEHMKAQSHRHATKTSVNKERATHTHKDVADPRRNYWTDRTISAEGQHGESQAP